MSDQILRMEARSNPIANTSHLVQHILGEIRPRNAVPRPGLPAVSVLVNDVDAARAAMDAELAKPRRGAHPCRAVDFILAGPPPHDGPYAWKRAVVDAWAEATLDWVRTYCPDAPVAAAAVHWDERSPHMHLLLAPIVREGAKVRLGIKAIRKRLASGVEAPQRKRGQHRDELSAVQDAYHKHVARRFGLERGNTQSTARHVKVDALEGAQRRLNDLKGSEAAARRAHERAQAAQTEANALEARRGDLSDEVTVLEVRVTETTEVHARLEAEYSRKREEVAEAHEKEEQRLDAELATLRGQAQTAREARDTVRAALGEAKTAAEAEEGRRKKAETEAQQAAQRRDEAQEAVTVLEARKSTLRGDVATAQQQHQAVETAYQNVRLELKKATQEEKPKLEGQARGAARPGADGARCGESRPGGGGGEAADSGRGGRERHNAGGGPACESALGQVVSR